jgi:hypothetical protein
MYSPKAKETGKTKLIRKIRLQEEQISEMRLYIETLKQLVKECHSMTLSSKKNYFYTHNSDVY